MQRSIIIKYPKRGDEVKFKSKIGQVLAGSIPPGHDKKSRNFVVKEEVIKHDIGNALGL